MTIYKPKTEDRKAEKKLDPTHTKIRIPEDVTPLAAAKKRVVAPAVLVVPAAVQRKRRRCICGFTMCFLILTVAVLTVSGILLCRFLAHKRLRCKTTEVRYFELQKVSAKLAQPHGSYRRIDGSFTEDIEMDLETGLFERISVPPILESRRSTVLHDFETNWTAIADHDNHRCFVLPLNRQNIQPPRNFADLLDKYDSGYYLPDAELVRENYKVQIPAVMDLRRFGVYISYDCRFYSTYQLVPDLHYLREKRSSCGMVGDSYCLGDAGTNRMLCLKISGCV